MKVQMQNYNNHCANTLVLKETGKNVSQGDGWNLKHPHHKIIASYIMHLGQSASFSSIISLDMLHPSIIISKLKVSNSNSTIYIWLVFEIRILHFDIFFWEFGLRGFFDSSHYCYRLHIIVYLILRNIKCTVKINITKRRYVKGDQFQDFCTAIYQ